MELVVVTVPDCPNASMLEARLAQALAETGAAAQATITRHTASDAEQAARWQMRGSPAQPARIPPHPGSQNLPRPKRRTPAEV